MLRRWVGRLNTYILESHWVVVPFQPVLYFFIFGASIRLGTNREQPIDFDGFIAPGFYELWVFLGIIGPLITLLSWWLIQKVSGRWRFIGLWLRLSGDVQVFTIILAYHIITTAQARTESTIYSRYIVGASIIFVIAMIIRDVWVLVVTERLAARIHRGENVWTT